MSTHNYKWVQIITKSTKKYNKYKEVQLSSNKYNLQRSTNKCKQVEIRNNEYSLTRVHMSTKNFKKIQISTN